MFAKVSAKAKMYTRVYILRTSASTNCGSICMLLPSGILPGQIQNARRDTVELIHAGNDGSVRKLSEVPTRSQVVGVGSGSGVRPRELFRAAGILQKRSVSARYRPERPPQLVGVRCGHFLPPMSSNYTPAPVGALWGCCAFCEPVGAVRNPAARALISAGM